jgi:hypothetical protein
MSTSSNFGTLLSWRLPVIVFHAPLSSPWKQPYYILPSVQEFILHAACHIALHHHHNLKGTMRAIINPFTHSIT